MDACNTAERRRLKEAVSFMVVERNVGELARRPGGAMGNRALHYMGSRGGGLILVYRRTKSGQECVRDQEVEHACIGELGGERVAERSVGRRIYFPSAWARSEIINQEDDVG